MRPVATSDGAIARQLAAQVKGSRADFAQVFDRVAALRQTDRYLDFKLAALGQPGPLPAYTAAFVAALAGNWCPDLVAHAIEAQLMPALALRSILDRFTARDAATEAAFNPQGFDAKTMPWLNTGDYTAGLLAGMRRLCVVAADEVYGTGFLVGPQAVLTNWHVIQHLLVEVGGEAVEGEGSAAKLVCRFDFFGNRRGHNVPVAEKWLLDWSPLDLDTVSEDQRHRFRDRRGTRPGPALDYAILRLRGAPGRARHWYSLKQSAAVPQGAQQALFVLQHPAQMSQRVGVAHNVECDDGIEIRHRAPTAEGSSGGLCLDRNGALVGLHRAEFRTDGKFQYNTAVAASAIAANLPAGLDVEAAVDEPVWRLSRCQGPVIARDASCRLLRQMGEAGARPILIVRGLPQSGKSFTTRLLQEYLPASAPWLASFGVTELPLQARELAEQILQRAGVAAERRASLPQPLDAATTDIAWIRDELFPAFRTLLRQAAAERDPAQGRLLWLVIDQLDITPLPEAGARRFLDTLYQQIAATPEMRVVLLGLEGPLPAGDARRDAREDQLPDPARLNLRDIEHYIGCLFTEQGLAQAPDEVSRLARLAWRIATQRGAATALPALASFLAGPLRSTLTEPGEDA